jgi:hypothetical protein
VADHLRAALAAGLIVRGLVEEPVAVPSHEDSSEPHRAIGEWRWWPWELLDWVPDAARIAWDTPSIMVWHFERGA